jgi:hypothetical protein
MRFGDKPMRTLSVWGAMLVLTLVVAGCSFESKSCSTVSGISAAQSCTGSIPELDSNLTVMFDLDAIPVVTSAHTEINITVETGIVRVLYDAPSGETMSGEASPNFPLTLNTDIAVRADRARVTFEAMGGIATNISYVVRFE